MARYRVHREIVRSECGQGYRYRVALQRRNRFLPFLLKDIYVHTGITEDRQEAHDEVEYLRGYLTAKGYALMEKEEALAR